MAVNGVPNLDVGGRRDRERELGWLKLRTVECYNWRAQQGIPSFCFLGSKSEVMEPPRKHQNTSRALSLTVSGNLGLEARG